MGLHFYLVLYKLGFVVIRAHVLRTCKDFVIIHVDVVSAEFIRVGTSLHRGVILVVAAVRIAEITVYAVAASL